MALTRLARAASNNNISLKKNTDLVIFCFQLGQGEKDRNRVPRVQGTAVGRPAPCKGTGDGHSSFGPLPCRLS